MFEYNKWDVKQWQEFWKSDNVTEMLKDYERPLYIHVGTIGNINTTKFNNECFEEYVEGKLYNVTEMLKDYERLLYIHVGKTGNIIM